MRYLFYYIEFKYINQELSLKQNKINKSRYSYNNSNNSNGRNQNIVMNNNYYNGNFLKENKNKIIKSINYYCF